MPAQRRAEFVVRNKTNRRVDGGGEVKALWEIMANASLIGHYELALGRTKYQTPREAMFAVRCHGVTSLSSKRVGGRLPPASLYAVSATEQCPSDGDAPIERLLLTRLSVEILERVESITGWYRARCEIEIHFHALRSGCRIEVLRLESDDRLENVITIEACETRRRHVPRPVPTRNGD